MDVLALKAQITARSFAIAHRTVLIDSPVAVARLNATLSNALAISPLENAILICVSVVHTNSIWQR
jgi:hypothetical protein